MKDGYIRVASASIDTLIGNVKHNANEIKKAVSYTHLDVYKRQIPYHQETWVIQINKHDNLKEVEEMLTYFQLL